MTEMTNMSTMSDKTIKVDVEIYADLVCPWCFIGKRRLDAAFARRPHVTPNYIWRCFMLNPNMPNDGMNRQAYLHAKFGDSAQAVYGRIAEVGLDTNINFNFDAISKTPNSRNAHKLLLAAGSDSQMLSERLYSAYFIEGLDIGDNDILDNIAAETGQTELVRTRHDIRFDHQLENDLAMARQLNMDGVPYFIFGGAYAIAGAHEADHLLPAIDAASS
ncbi:DsbA family oxidoreductase [Alphaproteobacteria bacterium]|nr:DsbA family oxidoreductase [Alphaproteobacteria bacterium]